MDYQYTRNDRHSQRMETLSLIMGAIALVTMCTVYPTLICGSLGIVFALLSAAVNFPCSHVPKSVLPSVQSRLASLSQ